MESVGDIHACSPAASGNATISPSGKTVMGDGKSTNKTSRATAYVAVGTAGNIGMSIVPKERNTAGKMFLVAFWNRVCGVLCFIPLNTEHPCGGNSFN